MVHTTYVNNLALSQECLLEIWWTLDVHFFKLIIIPMHGDGLYPRKQALTFLVLGLQCQLLATHFAICHTSYWCLTPGYFFLISDVVVTCLSVVKHRTCTLLARTLSSVLLHPSASIAFDEVTSVTWTTLKAGILPVARCMCHTWQSVQGYHTDHLHRGQQNQLGAGHWSLKPG